MGTGTISHHFFKGYNFTAGSVGLKNMAIHVHAIRKVRFLRNFFFWVNRYRAESKCRDIEPFLRPCKTILDLGTGTGNITIALRERGFDVTSVDVEDLSLSDAVRPVLYDGVSLPFADGTFDVALVLFVLHHTRDPERVLDQAVRVSRRLVVMEDIYINAPHFVLTKITDSVLNQEFHGHPHTNKTDIEWRKVFQKAGLFVRRAKYHWCFPMRHAVYYLESNNGDRHH